MKRRRKKKTIKNAKGGRGHNRKQKRDKKTTENLKYIELSYIHINL